MDAAKQRIRAAVARKKKKVKLAKGTEEGTSSAPKIVSKVSKRKPNGNDDRLSKRTVVVPGDASPKGSHPLSQAMVRAKGQ